MVCFYLAPHPEYAVGFGAGLGNGSLIKTACSHSHTVARGKPGAGSEGMHDFLATGQQYVAGKHLRTPAQGVISQHPYTIAHLEYLAGQALCTQDRQGAGFRMPLHRLALVIDYIQFKNGMGGCAT